MLTDNHNHTKFFSPDAKMSIEEMNAACISNNVKRLAITEHYEIDYPYKNDPLWKLFDIKKYQESFTEWKKALAPQVELLWGIELGFKEGIEKEIDDIGAKYSFDSVILSAHLFEEKDFYFDREVYERYSKNELITKYVELLVSMADKCNNYCTIGHYDYINRYSSWEDPAIYYSICPKQFDNLFEILASKEKSLEINTRSIFKMMQKNSINVLPDKELLLRFKDVGGRLISLGSDSHTSDTIGFYFNEVGEYLKSLGFDNVCYFKNMKPYQEGL